MKSFSGRNDFLKAPVFGFYDSLPFGLQESREMRALTRWVFGVIDIQKCKKFLPKIFFCVFELPLWIY